MSVRCSMAGRARGRTCADCRQILCGEDEKRRDGGAAACAKTGPMRRPGRDRRTEEDFSIFFCGLFGGGNHHLDHPSFRLFQPFSKKADCCCCVLVHAVRVCRTQNAQTNTCASLTFQGLINTARGLACHIRPRRFTHQMLWGKERMDAGADDLADNGNCTARN